MQGIFGMIKDLTGNKSKHGQDTEDFNAPNVEELSAVFSTVNFSLDSRSKLSTAENVEDIELGIGKCYYLCPS